MSAFVSLLGTQLTGQQELSVLQAMCTARAKLTQPAKAFTGTGQNIVHFSIGLASES